MNNIEKIKNHPTFKEIMADSFGGVMYNVSNRGKYDSAEILKIWAETDHNERSAAGGVVQGAMNFLQESV